MIFIIIQLLASNKNNPKGSLHILFIPIAALVFGLFNSQGNPLYNKPLEWYFGAGSHLQTRFESVDINGIYTMIKGNGEVYQLPYLFMMIFRIIEYYLILSLVYLIVRYTLVSLKYQLQKKHLTKTKATYIRHQVWQKSFNSRR